MKTATVSTAHRRSAQPRLAAALLASLALIGLSACGQEVANGGAASSDETTTSPTRARPADMETPGQAMEILYPKGAALAVVGVAHDDVLDVRQGPTTDFDVITSMDPTGEGAVATGRGWLAKGSAWIEVRTDQGTGWADLGSLAPRDGTEDVTAQVINGLGSRPTAANMADLGRIVAEALSSTEPPSSVVMSVAPTMGDLGEVSYDVVGLADDSIWAQRLHIFGQQESAGDEFSLKSVEATYFCARGTSSGGLCP